MFESSSIKPIFVDTHAHLQLSDFDADRDEVIRRAFDAGVDKIIVVSTDIASSRQSLQLAEKFSGVYAAVGFHPTDCGKATDHDFALIADLAHHPKVVAIGEIGLDFYWKNVPPEIQQRAFVRQLHLAKELGKPVIIHNRDAGAAILQALQQAGSDHLAGVFHCFSENLEYAQRVLALGCHISFTGNLTYKKSMLPEVAAQVPLERLLLETDAPFMTPVPHRGKRNEPAFAVHIAEKLADIKKIPVAAVAQQTTLNATRLFGLSESTI
ncbi:MAG: TatD family hydrolase [candidate division KSB1 bacterium]|nr:TatD family hydrolase [candidate division KSB1 bacterium]MDZ7303436.1 TatD family hydrolase [candidate division KSB1 bacterium]MDZ7312518.1 TatD family hydrolase [candidate division KSB1 bacterium]